MNNGLYFLFGGIVGSVVTYFVCDSIYKAKLSKQVDDIYNYYQKDKESKEDPKTEQKEVKPQTNYTEIIHTYSNPNIGANTPAVKPVKGPRPISSKDAGNGGYKLVDQTWQYYTDGILVDADNNVLTPDEIERKIGSSYAEWFGTIDVDKPDLLYVRNEALGVDFEIFNTGEEYGDLIEESYEYDD